MKYERYISQRIKNSKKFANDQPIDGQRGYKRKIYTTYREASFCGKLSRIRSRIVNMPMTVKFARKRLRLNRAVTR